jgi:F0F1-type ATP synthase assembly protein I
MTQTIVDKTADYIAETVQQAARKTNTIADAIEDSVFVVKRAARQGGDAAEEFLNDTTKLVQRNLWATMAATLIVGVMSGAMIGWMMKRR